MEYRIIKDNNAIRIFIKLKNRIIRISYVNEEYAGSNRNYPTFPKSLDMGIKDLSIKIKRDLIYFFFSKINWLEGN